MLSSISDTHQRWMVGQRDPDLNHPHNYGNC